MHILGVEIKRHRRPNLSRDVIPEIQGFIGSLSEGLIDLTKRVDQLSKDLEATRRKVYRDRASETEPQPEVEAGVAVPIDNRRDGPVRELRTGDPVSQ